MHLIAKIDARTQIRDEVGEFCILVRRDEWTQLKDAVDLLERSMAYVEDAESFPGQYKAGVVKKLATRMRKTISALLDAAK